MADASGDVKENRGWPSGQKLVWSAEEALALARAMRVWPTAIELSKMSQAKAVVASDAAEAPITGPGPFLFEERLEGDRKLVTDCMDRDIASGVAAEVAPADVFVMNGGAPYACTTMVYGGEVSSVHAGLLLVRGNADSDGPTAARAVAL